MDLVVVEQPWAGAIIYQRLVGPAGRQKIAWSLSVSHSSAIMQCDHNGTDQEKVFCDCWRELIWGELDVEVWTDVVSRLGTISVYLPIVPRSDELPASVWAFVMMQRVNNNSDMIVAAVSDKYRDGEYPKFTCVLRTGEGALVLIRTLLREIKGTTREHMQPNKFSCSSSYHTWSSQERVVRDLTPDPLHRIMYAAHAICKAIFDQCYHCTTHGQVSASTSDFSDLVPG